jgi:hypothetical protein
MSRIASGKKSSTWPLMFHLPAIGTVRASQGSTYLRPIVCKLDVAHRNSNKSDSIITNAHRRTTNSRFRRPPPLTPCFSLIAKVTGYWLSASLTIGIPYFKKKNSKMPSLWLESILTSHQRLSCRRTMHIIVC